MLQFTISTRTCLLPAALFIFAISPHCGTAGQEPSISIVPDSEQRWFGVMDIEGVRQFRFYLQLSRENSQWKGTLKSLDEGSQNFRMSEIESTDAGLSFSLPDTAARYESTWDADEGYMRGTWTQRGQSFGLSFRQVRQCPSRESKVIWKGTLNLLIQKLDVAFVELEPGKWVFDSISQNAGGFYAIDESTEDEVVLRVPAVKGVFTGRYSEDKSELSGKWSQGWAKLDLSMTQVSEDDLSAPVFKRSQTPKPPFPYESREVHFASKADGVTLAGTLTLPNHDTRALAILVSGSGPQDRDESILGHQPFLLIADHFARHGIATLRYDDRGTADSTGHHASATSYDFADDAEGALEFALKHSELEGIPIGICGHSEGGIIGPIVAARNEHVGFLILLAGTGVSGEEVLYSQSRLILEAENTPEDEIEKYAIIQRALISTVMELPNAERTQLEEHVRQTVRASLNEDDIPTDELEESIAAGITQLSSPWFRTFLVLEPSEVLTSVRCPVLALNGEKDLQVDPDLNLSAIEAALEQAPTDTFEIVRYPQLNHLFQSCQTGSVSEYEAIEETFNMEPLRKMTEWILSIAR